MTTGSRWMAASPASDVARSEEKPRHEELAPAPGLGVFSAAVYTIGGLFIVIPVFDLLLNLWPMAPGELGWRYGALGLFANFLHTPLLGALIVTLFAAAARHRRVLLAGGILWWVGTAVLLLALITFAFDALQLRATVLSESRLVYQTSVARALGKHATSAVAFGLLGYAAIRAARRLKPARGSTSRRGA